MDRGCYGCHMPIGAWTSYGPALRPPLGPLHWAGAEYAHVWNGYMDGAVRSGEATAAEVLGRSNPQGGQTPLRVALVSTMRAANAFLREARGGDPRRASTPSRPFRRALSAGCVAPIGVFRALKRVAPN